MSLSRRKMLALIRGGNPCRWQRRNRLCRDHNHWQFPAGPDCSGAAVSATEPCHHAAGPVTAPDQPIPAGIPRNGHALRQRPPPPALHGRGAHVDHPTTSLMMISTASPKPPRPRAIICPSRTSRAEASNVTTTASVVAENGTSSRNGIASPQMMKIISASCRPGNAKNPFRPFNVFAVNQLRRTIQPIKRPLQPVGRQAAAQDKGRQPDHGVASEPNLLSREPKMGSAVVNRH